MYCRLLNVHLNPLYLLNCKTLSKTFWKLNSVLIFISSEQRHHRGNILYHYPALQEKWYYDKKVYFLFCLLLFFITLNSVIGTRSSVSKEQGTTREKDNMEVARFYRERCFTFSEKICIKLGHKIPTHFSVDDANAGTFYSNVVKTKRCGYKSFCFFISI